MVKIYWLLKRAEGLSMEAFSDCKVIAIHGDGGAIHTPDEFLCVDSLVERARLSTLLLMRLAQGHLKTAA